MIRACEVTVCGLGKFGETYKNQFGNVKEREKRKIFETIWKNLTSESNESLLSNWKSLVTAETHLFFSSLKLHNCKSKQITEFQVFLLN